MEPTDFKYFLKPVIYGVTNTGISGVYINDLERFKKEMNDRYGYFISSTAFRVDEWLLNGEIIWKNTRPNNDEEDERIFEFYEYNESGPFPTHLLKENYIH